MHPKIRITARFSGAFTLVRPEGFEPPAFGIGIHCDIQLRHGRIVSLSKGHINSTTSRRILQVLFLIFLVDGTIFHKVGRFFSCFL